MYYDIHIFCCINEKTPDKKSCSMGNAKELGDYLKLQCKLPDKKVRVSKSLCLGRCALGPVIVIYPEGIWYNYKDKNDLDLIIEQHIKCGKIVRELQIQDA